MPFAPTDIASLKLWYKADGTRYQDATMVTPANADNDPVGAWVDASSSLSNALQGTAGFKPLYKTNIQNGLPAIRFDGSNDYLIGGTLSSFITNSDYNVFAVFNATSIATADSTTYNNDCVMQDNGDYWGLYLKSTPTAVAYNWDGNDDNVAIAITTGTACMIEQRHTGGNLYISKDTGAESSVASGNTSVVTGVVELGANVSGSKYAPIDLYEICIFNASISSADRTSMQNYLSRWGTYAAAGQPTSKRFGGIPHAAVNVQRSPGIQGW